MPPTTKRESSAIEGVTLELVGSGWLRLCTERTGGTYSDNTIAPLLRLNPSTVYRVRTRKLAPGPTFIAAALRLFGEDKFPELFAVVTTERAA